MVVFMFDAACNKSTDSDVVSYIHRVISYWRKRKKWCLLQFEIISPLPNTCVIQNLQMHKMACFQMFCKNALGNFGSDQTREEFYDKMQHIYWITNAKICICYLNHIKINISRYLKTIYIIFYAILNSSNMPIYW